MAIELTALDVRSKRSDFTKRFRGYDREEVDGFLEIVADRLEELTRERRVLEEDRGRMEAQLSAQVEREQAIKDAVVTAQVLRKEVIDAVKRKAEVMESEAELRAERIEENARDHAREIRRESDRQLELAQAAVDRLHSQRERILRAMRRLLEAGHELIEGESRLSPGHADGVIGDDETSRSSVLEVDLPSLATSQDNAS